MPKERTHLLLAERTLPLLKSTQGGSPCGETLPSPFYLLGAIMPDLLFYDLPSLTLSSLGSVVHEFEGERGLAFFRNWLREEPHHRNFDAWSLGMVNHFGADGLWHPLIAQLSTSPRSPCPDLRLPARECHHWIESEIEAHWLRHYHPQTGHVSLRSSFRSAEGVIEDGVCFFREFLRRAGFPGVPSRKRIKRCLLWQCFLLTQFGHPLWAKCRPRLLKSKIGRYLGALIVPSLPSLPHLLASRDPGGSRHQNPFAADFLERTTESLAIFMEELSLRSL